MANAVPGGRRRVRRKDVWSSAICWERTPFSIGDFLKNPGIESGIELCKILFCILVGRDAKGASPVSAHLPEGDTRIEIIEIGFARDSGTRDVKKLAIPCDIQSVAFSVF
jgi:hypothetical protein